MLLVLLGVIVLAVAGFKAMQPQEPEYQGRTLTEWLKNYDSGISQQQQSEALVALRSMGPEVLPILVDMAAFDPRDRKYAIRLWLAQHGAGRQRLSEDYNNYGRACVALCALEADAYPAIPQLVARLGTVKDDDTLILAVLEDMEAAAVPELRKALNSSSNDLLKSRAITILRLIGEPASPALPDLMLIRKEPKFQSAADAAIRRISSPPADEVYVPAHP